MLLANRVPVNCIPVALRLVISKAKLLERNVSLVYLSIVFYMFRGQINGTATHRSLRL